MNSFEAGFHPRLGFRRAIGRAFTVLCAAFGLAAVACLSVLLWRIFSAGLPYVSGAFLTHFPSDRAPELSGIRSSLWGTLWLILLTTLFSIPLGVGAALYLEEYAPRTRTMRMIQLNIANLAGVPSIVYGMLGLALFVRGMQLGRSVWAGALTLSLLVLPVIIIAAREAITAVPDSIRQASFGLGATRWQTLWHHVLPAALPGIMTGVILALSRAIGEAAPLIVLGIPIFLQSVPRGPGDEFTAMPLQIYHWTEQPADIYRSLAAGGIVVLLGILFSMNAAAVAIRTWHQKHK